MIESINKYIKGGQMSSSVTINGKILEYLLTSEKEDVRIEFVKESELEQHERDAVMEELHKSIQELKLNLLREKFNRYDPPYMRLGKK
jgi:hypothetical protein